MIDKRLFTSIESERNLRNVDLEYWFDFKKKKFLHNIDTFYYSVKFTNDFTADSNDKFVIFFRNRFENLYKELGRTFTDSIPYYVESLGNLNLLPISFSHFYSICLEKPDDFHIFIAPCVPKGASDESVTCECIVQIRSNMLWMYGVREAFKRSYAYVEAIAKKFNLEIAFAQENRCDFCFHTNYLKNPEKFFSIENFYKMRVDRYKGAHFNTEKVGSEDYLIDYVALGKRGQKCFVRIYLKSKEVIEMGYKPFFFKVWLFQGLINRYDLYCYEEAYKKKSWSYLTIARLKWYLEFGTNYYYKHLCEEAVRKADIKLKVTDGLMELADRLTPKINLVVNVEFQTMRKSSKSYCLLKLKDNSGEGAASRVYDFLDNHNLITEYLTRSTLRFVEPNGDTNKSRRKDCAFWEALRNAKYTDAPLAPENVKMVREYTRKLNAEMVKREFINKAVTLGCYMKGLNDDSPAQDVMDAIMILNDNDIIKAQRFKKKKSSRFSPEELAGLSENYSSSDYRLVSQHGEIYDNSNIDSFFNQQ